MIQGDSEEAAVEAISLVADSRVTHFYDPGHLAGRLVAASIGAVGQVAWDMYLFYESTSVWPAAPGTWFHQLGGAGREWADPARYRWSERLAEALSEEALSRWHSPQER